MKYKIGDRVKVKDLDWYNKNKDNYGCIKCGNQSFVEDMSKYCGRIVTITKKSKNEYHLNIDNGFWSWTDDMFEEIMKDEISFDTEYEWKHEFRCPDGYQFVDENGNVINATKIVLEKKKKEYPKTYEESCKVLGYSGNYNLILTTDVDNKLFNALYRLKVCRDAYWKIAGEQMGLGKAWEPDWKNNDYKFIIQTYGNEVGFWSVVETHRIFSFPTEEMRDAFYENFKNEIEQCKKLL